MSFLIRKFVIFIRWQSLYINKNYPKKLKSEKKKKKILKKYFFVIGILQNHEMVGNSQNWDLKQNHEIAGSRIMKSRNAGIPCSYSPSLYSILINIQKGTFQKGHNHVSKKVHSRIPYCTHSKNIPKKAHFKKSTFWKDTLKRKHIAFWSHSKKSTSYFDHIPKRVHSKKNPIKLSICKIFAV